MNRHAYKEITAIAALILLALALLDPFMYWMPSQLALIVLVLLVVLFGVFVAFVWHERVRDEREALHRMIAARATSTAGSTLLLVGILTEALTNHHVNPWLIVTFVTMMGIKLASTLYSQKKY